MEIADAIRAGGSGSFSWATVSAVPMPGAWPLSWERYWPLMTAFSLPAIRKIPIALRHALFGSYYRENELLVNYLRNCGKYDFYFDGCKVANRLELLRSEIPDIKLIHLVRHPGAILYHDFKAGIENVDYRLSQWSRFHRRARGFRPFLNAGNYFAVPYEHVVRSPENFLRRVSDFLDMDQISDRDPEILDRSKVHILGNSMRESVERIIDYSNTWRKHISDDSISRAEAEFEKEGWVSDLYREWSD